MTLTFYNLGKSERRDCSPTDARMGLSWSDTNSSNKMEGVSLQSYNARHTKEYLNVVFNDIQTYIVYIIEIGNFYPALLIFLPG